MENKDILIHFERDKKEPQYLLSSLEHKPGIGAIFIRDIQQLVMNFRIGPV